MAYNFLRCDCDQAFPLPPDICDWLPPEHLAWFVLDVVDQLDLTVFLAAYRSDGHGPGAAAAFAGAALGSLHGNNGQTR